jgi:hypothetical protein
VAGAIDYLTFTRFYFPAGVVDQFENRFVFQEPECLKGEISIILNKKRISDLIE